MVAKYSSGSGSGSGGGDNNIGYRQDLQFIRCEISFRIISAVEHFDWRSPAVKGCDGAAGLVTRFMARLLYANDNIATISDFGSFIRVGSTSVNCDSIFPLPSITRPTISPSSSARISPDARVAAATTTTTTTTTSINSSSAMALCHGIPFAVRWVTTIRRSVGRAAAHSARRGARLRSPSLAVSTDTIPTVSPPPPSLILLPQIPISVYAVVAFRSVALSS